MSFSFRTGTFVHWPPIISFLVAVTWVFAVWPYLSRAPHVYLSIAGRERLHVAPTECLLFYLSFPTRSPPILNEIRDDPFT